MPTFAVEEVRTYYIEAKTQGDALRIFDRDYNELEADCSETTEVRRVK